MSHRDPVQDLRPSFARALGPAWAANTVNGSALRLDGILTVAGTTHTAFYEPDGTIAVERFNMTDGSEHREHLRVGPPPWDAHRSISLGLDGRGRLHLAWGAHSSALWITRSRTPDIADGFEEPAVLGGAEGQAHTYPVFVHRGAGCDPLLLIREGVFDAAAWRVFRLDPEDGTWRGDAVPLLDGRSAQPWTAGPYPDAPVAGRDGRIELTYCWRLHQAASDAGAVGNIGVDHLVTEDGFRTLGSATGVRLSKPVTPFSTQRVWPVPLGAGLMNQCGTARGPDGTLYLATAWSDPDDGVPQYRLLWRSGAGWRMSTLSRFHTPYRLDGGGTLPTPHGRPKILIDGEGRCLLLFRSRDHGDQLMLGIFFPPDYRLEDAMHWRLWMPPLGYYEPVVDTGSWAETGTLALYVQRCGHQPDADRPLQAADAEAYVLAWSASALEDAIVRRAALRQADNRCS